MYRRASFHDRNKMRGGKVALDSFFCSTARKILSRGLSLFLFLSLLAVYGEGKRNFKRVKKSIHYVERRI